MELFTIVLLMIYFIALYFTVFWVIVFMESDNDYPKQKSSSSKTPLVSIIVPAYNEEESINKTLQSILSLEYPKEKMQIIVVDDGSNDKTAENVRQIIAQNSQYNISLIQQKNSGKGAALNNALKFCKGDFFACLDADSFVHSETLKKMIAQFMSSEEDVVIITPALKVSEPKKFWQKVQAIEYILSIFIAKLMSKVDCLYVAPGPFSIYKTKVIRDLGGFDENNLTEDQEIAYRVQQNQFKIKQCHSAYVYTNAPKTLKELYNQRNRWFKGGLFNAVKYKNMLLNKTYGDFGILQMSINVMLFIFSLTTIGFFSYYTIYPFFKNLHNFYLVGFDIMPLLRDSFVLNFDILSFDITTMLIINISLFITVLLIYISYKNADQNLSFAEILFLLPYLFIYYIILSFIAVIIMIELFIGKKQKW